MQSDEQPHRRHRAIVARTMACVGTPFYRQGRMPGVGLDCVGVALEAAAAAGVAPMTPIAGYTLSGDHVDRVLSVLRGLGCVERPPGIMFPADLLLFAPTPQQRHFAVLGHDMMIHAHVTLGRVVAQPVPPDLPLLSVWRFPEKDD